MLRTMAVAGLLLLASSMGFARADEAPKPASPAPELEQIGRDWQASAKAQDAVASALASAQAAQAAFGALQTHLAQQVQGMAEELQKVRAERDALKKRVDEQAVPKE